MGRDAYRRRTDAETVGLTRYDSSDKKHKVYRLLIFLNRADYSLFPTPFTLKRFIMVIPIPRGRDML